LLGSRSGQESLHQLRGGGKPAEQKEISFKTQKHDVEARGMKKVAAMRLQCWCRAEGSSQIEKGKMGQEIRKSPTTSHTIYLM
jgi:hypothetical protein